VDPSSVVSNVEHRRLTAQIKTLQTETDDFERDKMARDETVSKFDQVADLVANMDLERIW
jgi:hypothetical protein